MYIVDVILHLLQFSRILWSIQNYQRFAYLGELDHIREMSKGDCGSLRTPKRLARATYLRRSAMEDDSLLLSYKVLTVRRGPYFGWNTGVVVMPKCGKRNIPDVEFRSTGCYCPYSSISVR